MRSASRISRRSGVALLVVSLGISTTPLFAQPPAPAIGRTDSRQSHQGEPWELTLHHLREACGRKWVKKLGALTEEEYAWMARYHHGLYEVALEGQTLATIEILNTPNLRDCDLDQHWKTREMTIRVTYFFFDGSKKTHLTHIAVDPTFVNQAPRVYPPHGQGAPDRSRCRGQRPEPMAGPRAAQGPLRGCRRTGNRAIPGSRITIVPSAKDYHATWPAQQVARFSPRARLPVHIPMDPTTGSANDRSRAPDS